MVIIKTNFGDISLELNAEKAPNTVANFLSYVNAGHYKGTHQRIELAWARRLTADVALAQFHGGILESESWPTVKPLVVLHHKDGAWQIAAFQNSPIMNQTKVEETRQ